MKHIKIGLSHRNSTALRKYLKQEARTRLQPAIELGRQAVAFGLKVDASAESRKPPAKCLKESLQLQKRLRQLTHRVLEVQEDERANISLELRDEIAQTLLGINVRLLLLKQAARNKATGLKNEIASTQRLVVRSATLMRRLARELDNHRPTPSELIVAAI